MNEAWPRALGQRCTVHTLRNLLAKLPERHHREVKARSWAALDNAASSAQAKTMLQALARDYRRTTASAWSSSGAAAFGLAGVGASLPPCGPNRGRGTATGFVWRHVR